MIIVKTLLLVIGLLQVRNDPVVPDGITAKIDEFPEAVLVGASLPCKYTIKNESKEMLYLYMDFGGNTFPKATIVDKNNTEMPRQQTGIGGLHTIANDGYCAIHPGDNIKMSRDLSCVYKITDAKPGKYIFKIMNSVGIIETKQFNILDYRTIDSRELNGRYLEPNKGEDGYAGGKVKIKISIVDTIEEVNSRYILISDVKVDEHVRYGLPKYCYKIDNNFKLEKAEMDYYGQVWMVVKNDKESQLIVWKLNDMQFVEKIKKTKKNIAMESGRAYPIDVLSDCRIVVSGIEGEDKISTFSISPYSIGPSHVIGMP